MVVTCRVSSTTCALASCDLSWLALSCDSSSLSLDILFTATVATINNIIVCDRQKRQEAQSMRNMDCSVRNTDKQTVGRMEGETMDQYHNRRYFELQNCPHPTPKDILDGEQDPTAALVKFYMKSKLDARHDPPQALQNNQLVLFGFNIMKWSTWSDTVIQVLRSMDTFSRMLVEGQELRAAGKCMLTLQRCQQHENDSDSSHIDHLTRDKFESEVQMYNERIKSWSQIVVSNVDGSSSEQSGDRCVQGMHMNQSGNGCGAGEVRNDDEEDEGMYRDTDEIDEETMSNFIMGHAEFQKYVATCVLAIESTSVEVLGYQPSILEDSPQSYWVDVELAHGFEQTIHIFQTALCADVAEKNDRMEVEEIEIHKYALDTVMRATAARRLRVGEKVTCTAEYQHVLHVREQVSIEQGVVLPGDPCDEPHPTATINFHLWDMIFEQKKTCTIRPSLNFSLSNWHVGNTLQFVLSKPGERKASCFARITQLRRMKFGDIPDLVLISEGVHEQGSTGRNLLRRILYLTTQMWVQDTDVVYIVDFELIMAQEKQHERSAVRPVQLQSQIDACVEAAYKAVTLPCVHRDNLTSMLGLVDQIDNEFVSLSDKQKIIERYRAKMGKTNDLVSCAACGVRGLESDTECCFSTVHLTRGFQDASDDVIGCSQHRYKKRFGEVVKSRVLKSMFVERLLVREGPPVRPRDDPNGLFENIHQDQHLSVEQRQYRQRERKRIRDSLEKPPWPLTPEDEARWRLELCVHSRFWDDDTAEYYHLHPELVDKHINGSIEFDVCDECLQQLNSPIDKGVKGEWFALCNQYDFGWASRVEVLPSPADGFADTLLNLPPLSVPEQMLVAKVRICSAVFKYTLDTKSYFGRALKTPGHRGKGEKMTVLKGQCVAFENVEYNIREQDGNCNAESNNSESNWQTSSWRMLSAKEVCEYVNVYLLAPSVNKDDTRLDPLIRALLQDENLRVRKSHVLRHLHFHRRHTPGYQDLDLFHGVENDHKWSEWQHQFSTEMKERIIVENETVLAQADEQLTNDVANVFDSCVPQDSETVPATSVNDSSCSMHGVLCSTDEDTDVMMDSKCAGENEAASRAHSDVVIDSEVVGAKSVDASCTGEDFKSAIQEQERVTVDVLLHHTQVFDSANTIHEEFGQKITSLRDFFQNGSNIELPDFSCMEHRASNVEESDVSLGNASHVLNEEQLNGRSDGMFCVRVSCFRVRVCECERRRTCTLVCGCVHDCARARHTQCV